MPDFDTKGITAAITQERARIAQRNPWLGAGRAIANTPVNYGAMKPWERAITRAVQGFGSGAAAGYGARQVREESQDLNKRAYGALGSANPYEALNEDPALRDVASAFMASKYDYDLGQQSERDTAALKGLYDKGIVVDPRTQQVSSAGGYREAIGGNEAARKYGERSGTLRADTLHGYGAEAAKSRGATEGDLRGKINLGQRAKYNEAFGQETGKIAGQMAPIAGPDGQALPGTEGRRNPNIVDSETALRREFAATPVYKEFSSLSKTFDVMLTHYFDPTGASDLAFTIGIMKMLDPTSIVSTKEGESVVATGGFSAQMKGAYEQALKGQTSLTPETKKSLLGLAASKHDATKRDFDTQQEQFRRIVKERGGKAENVSFFPETSSGFQAVKSITGKTAVNPQTGQRLRFDGKGWVPLYGG